MRRAMPLVFGLVLACQDNALMLPEAPDTSLLVSECGASPVGEVGGRCVSFPDCQGAGNIAQTPSCELCPRQAAFTGCVQGQCEPLSRTGLIRVALEAPVTATGARSIITVAYDPVAADGTRLDCAGLLAPRCDRFNDMAGAVNANILEPIGGINDATPNFFSAIQSNVGDDRIVLVFITTASNGAGSVRAVGCADKLSVVQGVTTEVQVQMTSGPFATP